jgi:hypothetical protein
MDIVEGYLSALETALLLVVPVLLLLTAAMWQLAWKALPYRIPILLAVANTVTGACATWLAWTVLYRSRVGPVPFELLPVTATTVFLLCVVPFMTTAYVLWINLPRAP